MSIHPSAIVHPGARLGGRVQIGAFAIIDEEVSLDDDVVIGPRAWVTGQTTVGPETSIHHGAVIGHEPQDRAFKPGTESRLIIGSRNVIREFATIHRATTPGGATRIGDDCFLMAHSHVAHDCRLDDGVTLCNNALLAGHVQVGRRAFVSGNVVVHQFTRIGELCMISGGSAVGQDVLPYCTVTGRSQVRSMNVVGMRRAGINQAHRQAIKQACRAFFAARHDLAIAQLAFEEAPDLPEIRVLRDFVAAGSKRGYARPPRGRVEED